MTNPRVVDIPDELISQWKEAEAAATYWTARSQELRRQIFGLAFPAPNVGTTGNKVKIGHGMALLGDYRINYSIDRAAMEAGKGFIPAEVFEAVINYRPEVKEGAYRKLEDEKRRLFAPFITEKPGTPGLELKPAAKVRW